MSTHDKNGRPWAKLSELKQGDIVLLDEGFTCVDAQEIVVQVDQAGRLYFDCSMGKHLLEGQADDGEHLVGVYHARP